MKIRKPDYYDNFHCIAGACDFTCCREWKIAVDDATNARWKRMKPPAGMATRRKNLSLFTTWKDGGRVIAMEQNHNCPFLNEAGLCHIVCEYGEESISETCHTFPRETHDFGSFRELSLMPSCPVSVDLLREANGFHIVEEEVTKTKEGTDPEHKNRGDNETEGRTLEARDFLLALACESEESCEVTLLALHFIAESMLSDKAWKEEEIRRDLPELYQSLKNLPTNPAETWSECRELFLDLTCNYRQQGLYTSLLEDKIRLAEEMDEEIFPDTAFSRAWLAQNDLWKKWLAQEIYADCLIPGGDMESMVVRLQWIIMEYVLLRELCLLHYRQAGELSPKDARDQLVLTSRLMGYEEEDILDYMEGSFESLLWDWGYPALALGRLTEMTDG